jgi:DNA replication protein
MPIFLGFPTGKVHLTPIPAQFFTELLPQIDHLGELKVTLYAFWFLDRLEAPVRYLTYQDFAGDEILVQSLGGVDLSDCLERATLRGTLLKVTLQSMGLENALYFLNTPRGRAAVEAIQSGTWRPDIGTSAGIA